MLKSIIGKKVGMTQVFDGKGNLIPVTVVEAGPCVVTNIRTLENDGYVAVQLAFGDIEEKKLKKPQVGLFKKYNLSPKKIVREIRLEDATEFSLGQEIKADIFKAGDYVDVRAVSKGKGRWIIFIIVSKLDIMQKTVYTSITRENITRL